MRIRVDGARPSGVAAKDVILAVIARISAAGGTGHVIEYAGAAIDAMSMDERMTVCNMSIEAGARAGMVAPDDTTYAFLAGRPFPFGNKALSGGNPFDPGQWRVEDLTASLVGSVVGSAARAASTMPLPAAGG